MDKDKLRYVADLLNSSKDELLALIAEYRIKEKEQAAVEKENSKIMVAMQREHQRILDENKALKEENLELATRMVKMAEQLELRKRDLFGRGSEKLSDVVSPGYEEELIDEAETEEPIAPANNVINIENARKDQNNPANKKGKKRKGKRKEDLDRLPQRCRFILDEPALNEKHGAGKWILFAWKLTRTIEIDPCVAYTMNTFTPVIKMEQDEHSMITIPNPYRVFPGSFLSPSLGAWLLYQRFRSYLPAYRQETTFEDLGCVISRQTLTNWLIKMAQVIFYPIYCLLKERILEIPYHQCDETTWLVLRDGRAPGAKSYMWAHMASELYDCNPIILFCFELTRGTDHLREFYEDFKGFITSDAYCSYQVLGKENVNIIIVCGCMMHLRRRFAQAFILKDTSKMSEEEINELPEMKALILIGKVYDADEKLKNLPAEERFSQRQEKVKPLLEECFNFIEEIDPEDPLISDRLRDAVKYARNQKEFLSRFLEDGNIPIDNGSCERHIRPLTISRNNSLFSTSIEGAEAVAIISTMVETARANKANAYWYLRYVLERMPEHLSDTSTDFLEEMLPWSEQYRQYERIMACGEPPDPPPYEFVKEPMKAKIKNKHFISAILRNEYPSAS